MPFFNQISSINKNLEYLHFLSSSKHGCCRNGGEEEEKAKKGMGKYRQDYTFSEA
jgi:hypothetical protein